jgi:uncharacterized protein YbjT (DUF2867 family)
MYAVVGATGNTGGAVAEGLLSAGKDVTVIGRSKTRLQPLVGRGAQAFVGAVADAQAMTLAFSGAVGVYCMIPPRLDAPDVRQYQREIGESLTAAIHEAGVAHVVNLSSVGAQHADGTGAIAGLREQEERLNALEGVNVLHLRPGWFMENFFAMGDMIRSMNMMGMPVRGDMPMAMIATRDIGAFAAERLLKLDFAGKSTRELLGPRDSTLEEAARTLGNAVGSADLHYVQTSFEDAESALAGMGMSKGAVSVILEMYRAFNDGLIVPIEERSPENTTSTTMEEFGRVFAQMYDG